jgi:uncharacterized MAPEG superfamily protein
MSPELTALGVMVLVQTVLGIVTTAIVSKRTGTDYILSSRDASADLQTGFVGRMVRARTNSFEALIYFTPAVALVVLAEAGSGTTTAAAWTFVAARLGFVLCYALDLAPWRSLVWMVGMAAVVVMVVEAML